MVPEERGIDLKLHCLIDLDRKKYSVQNHYSFFHNLGVIAPCCMSKRYN